METPLLFKHVGPIAQRFCEAKQTIPVVPSQIVLPQPHVDPVLTTAPFVCKHSFVKQISKPNFPMVVLVHVNSSFLLTTTPENNKLHCTISSFKKKKKK